MATQENDNRLRVGVRRRHSCRRVIATAVVAAVSALTTSSSVVDAFAPPKSTTKTSWFSDRRPGFGDGRPSSSSSSPSSSTSLFVFDFFKKSVDSAVSEASANLAKFTDGLAKSRNKFLYDLEDALKGDLKNGRSFLDNLEDTLLQADLGVATTEDVLAEARSLREDSADIFTREDILAVLRGKLLEALSTEEDYGGHALRFAHGAEGAGEEGDANQGSQRPLTVHFIMGANGMGKTTTIGKLAHRLKSESDQKVLLAACDTFRAGAVSQLELWAERADVDCFSPSGATNGPSAVLFGALDKAMAEDYDVLLVDTSGRLSNNDALTQELKKMKRVIQKRMSVESDGETNVPVLNLEVPHETLLVVDAAQGRMALDSAKQWHKEVGLTGLILTKLDGSARGGSVVAVSRELGLPVKLVGVGEGLEDLRDFEPESFVDGLLGIGAAGGGSTSDDEGRALASRLDTMRKARDERAKERLKAEKSNNKKASGGAGGGIGGAAGDMTLQDMEFDGDENMVPITGGEGGGSRKSNKKKKKKKKKVKR